MATQGLLTIKEGRKVKVKIIAGCDGYNIEKIADIITKKHMSDINRIYDICLSNHFGCDACLVVMNATTLKGFNVLQRKTSITDEDYDRYWKTFYRPRFNPRWENGTADYVKIIKREVGK